AEQVEETGGVGAATGEAEVARVEGGAVRPDDGDPDLGRDEGGRVPAQPDDLLQHLALGGGVGAVGGSVEEHLAAPRRTAAEPDLGPGHRTERGDLGGDALALGVQVGRGGGSARGTAPARPEQHGEPGEADDERPPHGCSWAMSYWKTRAPPTRTPANCGSRCSTARARAGSSAACASRRAAVC